MKETDSSCTCTSSTQVQRPICCCIQDSEHSSMQPEFPSLLFSECVPVRLNSVTKCCQAASLVDSFMTDDQAMPRLVAVLVCSPKTSDKAQENGARPGLGAHRVFPIPEDRVKHCHRGLGDPLLIDIHPALAGQQLLPLQQRLCRHRSVVSETAAAAKLIYGNNESPRTQPSQQGRIDRSSLTAAGDERERVEVGLARPLRRGGAARIQVEVRLVNLRTAIKTIPDV